MKVAHKVFKATEAFHVKALILQSDYNNMIEVTAKMQAAASRKRKRVLVDGPQSVGAILDLAEPSGRRGGKGPVGRTRKRSRRSLSSYHVELDQEGLAELENDDIEDCIIVIPRK